MPDKTFAPNLFSKNYSIIPLRISKKEKDELLKYPLGKYPFRSVISFGSRSKVCLAKIKEIGNKGIVLNSPEAIARASDKVICKQIMKEFKIPTPEFQMMSELVSKDGPKFYASKLSLTFPVVTKLRKGSGGKGMSRINTIEELRAWRKGKTPEELQDFFIEEIFQPDLKKSCEYRISVSPWLVGVPFSHTEVDPKTEKDTPITSRLGDIVILRKKMKQTAAESGEFGRNLALGNSYFTRKFKRVTRKGGLPFNIGQITDMCVLACTAMELDFCAADVIYDVESGKWTIIELNTAPSMGTAEEGETYTLGQWKRALRHMIEEKAHANLEELYIPTV